MNFPTPGISQAARVPPAPVTLNGDWNLHVHGQAVETVRVPSSLRPRGVYRLQRWFLLPRLSGQQRAILHFEGITYYAQVWMNGTLLGRMSPYVPYEFDFTAHAKEGRNFVEVDIVDACPGPDGFGKDALAFGVTVGWETYGGIIRDVWAEVRPSAFIENVRFAYKLNDDFTTASCSPIVLVHSDSAKACAVELSLHYGGAEIAKVQTQAELKTGANEIALQFAVQAPILWSPDEPNLYELRVALQSDSAQHEWRCHTGFRQFVVRGTRFELNGEPITLRGICRMELWKDQGFTMTQAQREHDMRGIKKMGANFVRLQPFPHDRGIITLADHLGLMVSEEPGYWWADFRKCPRSFVDLGLDVLERNIRRDWNSPSVACWFLGNESYFTVSYLKEGKALCNRLDPLQRPVSIAHENAEPPEAKKLFDESAMDFYDWHAYAFSDDKFDKLPQLFGTSKPLTFSEWGWEDIGDGCLFHERYLDKLLQQVEAGRVAGYMFFDWNDYPQFTRVDWSTDRDGTLNSGVVNEARQAREPIYSRMAGLFAGKRELLAQPADLHPKALPLRSLPFSVVGTCMPVDLQTAVESDAQREAWAALEKTLEKFWGASGYASDQWERAGRRFRLWQGTDLEITGAPFRCPVVDEYVRPLIVSGVETTIPVHRKVTRLHILGQVTLPLGYPAKGTRGELIGEYTLEFTGGRKTVLPVRNGVECAQANCIVGATRISPIATSAQPAFRFTKDVAREHYQILLWSIPVESGELKAIHCMATSDTNHLAVFAISTEEA